MVAGLVLVLLGGKAVGTLLVKIVDAAASAAFNSLLLILYAAIYRAVSAGRSAEVFE